MMLGLAVLSLAAAPAFGAMESEDCAGCHGDRDSMDGKLFIDQERFAGTEHGGMGCTSCHGDISDQHPDDGLVPGKASCGDCHDQVSAEYARSNHGSSAACNDCHNPHESRGASEVSGYDMNQQCANCHETADVVKTHDKWLPQAGLHIESLPCVTCHTASENYVITLYVNRRAEGSAYGEFKPATHDELQQMTGDQDVARLIDSNGNSFITLDELKSFNRDPRYKTMRLYGMMTPERVTHDFTTLDNRWDCTFCHASGPAAMQTSYLSLPEKDGSWARYGVEKGAVLHALYGTPDFYMMGATRSKALNIAGLMIIAGGMVMPIGHGTLRFLTRKNRKDH